MTLPLRPATRGGPARWARADRRLGAALVVPALAITAVFVFVPLGRVLLLSLQGTDIFGRPAGWVGVRNYATMLGDPAFLRTMLTTAAFCAAVVAGRLVVGLLVTVPLTTTLRGMPVFRALLTSPMAMSVSAASVAFAAMLAPGTGLVDRVLTSLGGPSIPWLTDSRWALLSVVAVTVWGSLGFTVLLLLGAFGSIDPEVLEAARLDGAGPLRSLWSISLPLVTPTLFFVVVTGTVEALTTFGQIAILTQGGPAGSTRTLVYALYQQAFGSGSANFGLASALGVVLFVLVLGLSLLQFGVLEKRVTY